MVTIDKATELSWQFKHKKRNEAMVTIDKATELYWQL